ncbi:MAG: outer membrane protein assembly factor BamD [Bacteroidales bacterium]|jgi:outer membrane protein assembly factor BamD|nr:outer membrane protein assembly factor BamD [Bacteroidales bacterium]
MKYTKLILAGAALFLAIASCKSEYEMLLNSNDVDAKFAAAFDYFNQKKYSKAAQLFESMSVLTSGTERDDTVQYYWGLSNYRYKDFYTAETNFSKFIEQFPRSPFADDARFLRLDCLYRSTYRYELDQMPTYTCLQAIAEYLSSGVTDESKIDICNKMSADLNERLDRKAYENARLYYKMEDYKAARVAFKNVLKDDADNLYREDILYYTAMSSYNYARLSYESKQKERYLTFVDDYLNFIGEIPESKYRRELDVMYKRAQRALGRYTGTEEELNAKEKDFARERKELEKLESKKNETSAEKTR